LVIGLSVKPFITASDIKTHYNLLKVQCLKKHLLFSTFLL